MAEIKKEEPVKEQLFTLSFTRDEILERIKTLSQSENILIYTKAQKGAVELDELNKLMQLIEKK